MLYDLLGIQWARLQQELGLVESYEQYLDAQSQRSEFAEFPRRPSACFASSSAVRAAPACRAASCCSPPTDAMGPNGSGYPFAFLHERVAALCAEEQIPCLDLLPAFSKVKDPRTMWVSPFDAHPNAETNRRAAYEMLVRFSPIWHR